MSYLSYHRNRDRVRLRQIERELPPGWQRFLFLLIAVPVILLSWLLEWWEYRQFIRRVRHQLDCADALMMRNDPAYFEFMRREGRKP